MKDSPYFSHDSNAKDDPKCMLLIDALGLEGYGIYWVLIELLREQPEYKYPLNLVPILAKRYNTSLEKMKAVILNFNLFIIDNDEFFSLSLIKRMDKMNYLLEQKRTAGHIGANKRWSKQTENKQLNSGAITELKQSHNSVIAENSKLKEIKLNKRKGNKKKEENIYIQPEPIFYKEHYHLKLTNEQYEKLINEFGAEEVNGIIDNVCDKSQSYLKKYSNFNLLIRNWIKLSIQRQGGNKNESAYNKRLNYKFDPIEAEREYLEFKATIDERRISGEWSLGDID